MSGITEKLKSAIADRYVIERELGQGGMATVYLAHDVKHHRKVALKVLRAELAAILGADRFLAEIKTTANLQHPHILPLHDSGEAGGMVFYVMPYVEGESLRDRITSEKQLPVGDAVRIAREVADALDYAHRHGVVHRDIKPENILLHDGRAMVADFGIALAVSRSDGNTRMTETGMSLGTPHYMSPEQAMGEREITPKSDVYALGCVLYEMLTGEPPFTGPTAQAIIARVMTEEPRSLTLQRRTVPPHVEAAVETALAKLPADRFATAAEFSDALGRTDFSAAATTRDRPTGTPLPRPRVSVFTVALAAIAVSALGLAGWALLRQDPPPQPVRYQVTLRDGEFFVGQVGRELAMSRDGRTVIFSDTTGGPRLWIKTADRAEAVPIAGTEGGRGPALSPDEEWIVFASEGRVRKVPLLGGSAVTIADSANRPIPAQAWLDDGTVLYVGADFGLRAVHQDGGAVRQFTLSDAEFPAVVAMAGLPGGKTALIAICTTFCGESRLMALDVASGDMQPLGDDILRAWPVSGGRVVFARRDGGVFLAPFDAATRAFASPPVPVLDGVRAAPVAADMALAYDGTLLYVPGGTSGEIGVPLRVVRVGRDGRATPIDSAWVVVRANENGGIALSPDGRRLAIQHHGSGTDDIWIKELDNGPFTRLTFGGINHRPEWTADGRYVMYLDQSIASLLRRRADGTGAVDTLLPGTQSAWEVRRTPDTTRLLVRRNLGSRDIFLADLTRAAVGDSAITPLLAEPGYDEYSMMLSPDGRWLVYGSNESGRPEVYVRPFPNVDGGRWQVSRDGGMEPVWAHSGRELFFIDGYDRLVAVPVPATGAFQPGEPRVLFPLPASFGRGAGSALYVVSPDDRTFLFTEMSGGATEQEAPAVLIQHWLQGLDQVRGGGAR